MLGSSGFFTINQVDAEPPVVGSVDGAEAVTMNLTMRRDQDWWMGQQRLIAGRRAEVAVPLPLPVDSSAFIAWRASPGYDLAWTA